MSLEFGVGAPSRQHLVGLGFFCLVACSESRPIEPPIYDPDGDADAGLDFGLPAAGGPTPDPSATCGLSVAPGCSGEVFEGEAIPLDLYLLFDQSGSMSTIVEASSGKTRMDIVRGALDAFLRDPESAGIGIGLGYFGQMPLGATSCDPRDYGIPAVAFGELPDNALELNRSLEAQEPTGETPTGAALEGACAVAREHQAQTRGRVTAILLVTDGEPKAPLSAPECEPTLDEAEAAARNCLADANIATYVLGVGPALTNLERIARAGGTTSAYLADLDNQGQVLETLRQVRGAALPCSFRLTNHSSDTLDYSKSTVGYLDHACGYFDLAHLEASTACTRTKTGYFFDDPAAPTRIDLCPSTCAEVRANGQQLFYSIGCQLTIIK